MQYLIHILIMINIFIILAVSLNLLAGYTGILSMAHAAFYGIGAYISAIIVLRYSLPFVFACFAGMICSVLIGGIVGALSQRVHGDYFVMVTFAFQIITYSLFKNLASLTGGLLGLNGIPHPVIMNIELNTIYYFFLFSSICMIVVYYISKKIVESPFGRVLKAIREDEVFAISLGKPVNLIKISIFMISSAFAALAGSIYAFYIGFIDPTSFTIMESIFIMAIVILGGSGNIKGSVLGAAILMLLPELLMMMGMASATAANVKQILYGGLLVGFMVFKPQGFWGEYSYQR